MASGFKTQGNGIGEFDRYFMTTSELVDRYVGGKVWIGGWDEWGFLGDGTANASIIPMNNLFLGNQTGTWKFVSDTGNSAGGCAIKSDNTLWLWGLNKYGELGQNNSDSGSFVAHPSPVQVITGGAWKSISAGSEDFSVSGTSVFGGFLVGIKTDGTLWSWGVNAAGQLGVGDTTQRSSPVQEASMSTEWRSVAPGYAFTLAIKNDGSLWSWGYNHLGQLGLGDQTNRSTPVQVGGDTTWRQISAGGRGHSVGIKSDGTLWVWGSAIFGELGTNDRTSRSSPVQTVSAGTNWKQVTAIPDSTAAIKKDGTLWTWGNNGAGQLGVGDLVSRSSPIQVGSNTTWKTVNGSTYNNIGRFTAIKTDSTLWAWGSGAGTYGNPSGLATRSSPMQIDPGINGWVQAVPGGSGFLGLNIL